MLLDGDVDVGEFEDQSPSLDVTRFCFRDHGLDDAGDGGPQDLFRKRLPSFNEAFVLLHPLVEGRTANASFDAERGNAASESAFHGAVQHRKLFRRRLPFRRLLTGAYHYKFSIR